ncbi:hypothetical protein Bca4012_092660 [Brassica carinata]
MVWKLLQWRVDWVEDLKDVTEISAVRLVDAATYGCVGVNFFDKLLFVSSTPLSPLTQCFSISSPSPSPTTFELSHLHLRRLLSSLISSPSPTTFELSHLHLQFLSSLISSPSPTQTSRSFFSDDANHGLENSLTRALSLTSSISSSLHLSCLSLCLESSDLSSPTTLITGSKILSLELSLYRHRSQALSISLVSASVSSKPRLKLRLSSLINLLCRFKSSSPIHQASLTQALPSSLCFWLSPSLLSQPSLSSLQTWKPEETRYFFELYAEERRKGNKAGISMNKVGKANIMEAFEQRFKKNLPDWKPYKSKYDTSRKKYIKIKTLTQNRTGLGFDDMGRIDMSDDWSVQGLEDLYAKRLVTWMFEAEFGGVVVTGAEGWSAQHGEASLNSRVGEDDRDDEADSQPAAETQALETETQPQAPRQTQPSTQNHFGSSRAKRRRKEKDMVVEACVKRTEALEVKNKIAELMLERQEAFSIENVLEILYALPEVREWSPLYEAAMEILIDNEGNRRAFVTMKTDEAKIRFLELRTKIKRDDD